jgi:hypothetical protein
MDSAPLGGHSGHTRRSFVKRSGLLAGAFWLAATGWDKTLGRAVAAFTPSAEERHRRTYVALVDAVAASEQNTVPAAGAAEVGKRFDAWYAAQPAHTQRVADSVLEDLEDAFGGRAFHKAARADRLEFVRERAHGPYRNRADRRGTGEAKGGKERSEQIREAAEDSKYRADPTDFSTAKPVPGDSSAPSIPKPTHTKDDVRRTALMEAALLLVAAPLDPTALDNDPEDLTKVDVVAV